MKTTYNKLVRDNIPQIIGINGQKAVFRELGEKEYWQYLLKKDKEELSEVATAEKAEDLKDELADKLEVLRAMAEFKGFTLQEIIEQADRKAEARGKFQRRLLLVETD